MKQIRATIVIKKKQAQFIFFGLSERHLSWLVLFLFGSVYERNTHAYIHTQIKNEELLCFVVGVRPHVRTHGGLHTHTSFYVPIHHLLRESTAHTRQNMLRELAGQAPHATQKTRTALILLLTRQRPNRLLQLRDPPILLLHRKTLQSNSLEQPRPTAGQQQINHRVRLQHFCKRTRRRGRGRGRKRRG